MMKDRLVAQFSHPRGMLGRVAGRIMATRCSNVERNRWIVEVLAAPPEARILELGHGPGLAIAAIWPTLSTGHITGVEVSELMSQNAADRNRGGAEAGIVDLRVADATGLPDDLGSFDIIFGVNVSMFWPQPDVTIANLASKLNPGGRLVLAYMPPPTADEQAESVSDKLVVHFENTGLEGIERRTMDFDPPAIATIGHRA